MTNAQLQRQPWDLTEAESKHNDYHLDKLLEAYEANDEEAIAYHRSLIFTNPDSLMASKLLLGAQSIRDRKLNTTLADRKFGHDWLDK